MKTEESTLLIELQTEVAQLRDTVRHLEQGITEIGERTPEDRATLVVFSGDLDKLLAGFVIATGAAAAGLETTIFFTFWGLCALKKAGVGSPGKKNIKEKMFAMMTPSSSETLGVSRMNFMGIGAKMLRSMMKDKGIASLDEFEETVAPFFDANLLIDPSIGRPPEILGRDGDGFSAGLFRSSGRGFHDAAITAVTNRVTCLSQYLPEFARLFVILLAFFCLRTPENSDNAHKNTISEKKSSQLGEPK